MNTETLVDICPVSPWGYAFRSICAIANIIAESAQKTVLKTRSIKIRRIFLEGVAKSTKRITTAKGAEIADIKAARIDFIIYSPKRAEFIQVNEHSFSRHIISQNIAICQGLILIFVACLSRVYSIYDVTYITF